MQNIGHLYYKEYFKNIEFQLSNDNLKIENLGFEVNNLFDLEFSTSVQYPEVFENSKDKFELTTIYPGLLIGSGYNHEIGGKELEGELKLGFFFDHTTGLPCIPGSSVKGVLRDACEKVGGEYILSILKELAKGTIKSEVKNEAKEFYCKRGNRYSLLKKEKQKYSDFIKLVFEGKKDKENYLPLSKRDIFFDAFPIGSKNVNGKFLANDYITHHKDPLKDPNPIQFLKVLPQVTFRFEFKLTDEGMKANLKRELFRQILLDLGIGAKTNVGYGQFTDNVSETENKQTVNYNDNASRTDKNKGKSLSPKQIIPLGTRLNKNEEYEAIIYEKSEDYFFFKFSKGKSEIKLCKKIINVYKKFAKNDIKLELNKNDKVILKIQAEFFNSEGMLNFQVLSAKKH